MNRPTRLLLFFTITLSACVSPHPRTAGGQAPAPVVEANTIQTGPAAQNAKQPAKQSEKPGTAQTSTAQKGRGAYLEGDGPGGIGSSIAEPSNIDAIPDAVPRAEPLLPSANHQYVALGQTFTPINSTGNYRERGIASWYGKKFHGQNTSSGEIYDMYGMTAAHPILPIPSYARITNLANHKSVVVRINDRGPFLRDRIIDLSYTAAHKLGIINNGSTEVEVESIAADGQIATPIALTVAEPVTSKPLEPERIAQSDTHGASNIYLQLGAFKSREGAESFLSKMRVELEGCGKQVMLYQKDNLVRVHLGPYASVAEARTSAEQLQSRLQFKPLISTH